MLSGADAGQYIKSSDHCDNQAIAPNDTCTVDVAFKPSGTAATTVSLDITSDAASSIDQLALSGTGVEPALSASPEAKDFGNQRVGTTSAAQTFTIKNVGTETLTVAGAALAGADAGQFGESNDDCSGQQIPPNDTCTVDVAFRPTSSGAHDAASLDITNDAASSIDRLPLKGTGTTAPPIEPLKPPPGGANNAPPAEAPAVMRVRTPKLSVFGRTGSPARCRMQSGVIRACAVRLLHGRRVLARGRKLASAPNAHALTVRVKLTKRGRKLLADHLGGVHVKVAAIGATGDGTRSARARSRAILGREHFVTPPGSWLPDQSSLSKRGRRFLRSRRAKLIAVAILRCDGYSAKVREESPNAARISRARAARACSVLRRRGSDATAIVIGHGDSRPIASNATPAGQARNRRVEVTITHRHTPHAPSVWRPTADIQCVHPCQPALRACRAKRRLCGAFGGTGRSRRPDSNRRPLITRMCASYAQFWLWDAVW